MSYLARLKIEFSAKHLPRELTKPTEGPSVSFVGAQGRHIPEFEEADDPGPALFDFAPPGDPESDREAIVERAAIIAEGCGMDPAQALQEALWKAHLERAWRAFLRNAEHVLGAPEAARAGLLDRYHAGGREPLRRGGGAERERRDARLDRGADYRELLISRPHRSANRISSEVYC